MTHQKALDLHLIQDTLQLCLKKEKDVGEAMLQDHLGPLGHQSQAALEIRKLGLVTPLQNLGLLTLKETQ